jgi:hypothetical protein
MDCGDEQSNRGVGTERHGQQRGGYYSNTTSPEIGPLDPSVVNSYFPNQTPNVFLKKGSKCGKNMNEKNNQNNGQNNDEQNDLDKNERDMIEKIQPMNLNDPVFIVNESRQDDGNQ